MKVKMKDVPPEVWEACVIMQKDIVGEFLYNKAVDAVNKYPQYFSKDEVEWAREYKERNNENRP